MSREQSDCAGRPRVGRACSAEANGGGEMLFSSSGDLGKIGLISTPGNRIWKALLTVLLAPKFASAYSV